MDKKSEIYSALNTSLGFTSLHIPSSPRSLPWSPAPKSASLKQKLNLLAQAFFPSKQRKGDDSLPIVVSPSSNQATTTTTTMFSSTSRVASVAYPSITTPAGGVVLPATSTIKEGSLSASSSQIVAPPPTSLPESTPLLEQFSPLLTSCSTTPISLPSLPPALQFALSTPVSLATSLSSSSSFSSPCSIQPAPFLVSSSASLPATPPKEFIRPWTQSRYSQTSFLEYQAQSLSSLSVSFPVSLPASHTVAIMSSLSG